MNQFDRITATEEPKASSLASDAVHGSCDTSDLYGTLREQAVQAVTELLEQAELREGQILVIGCSSSEILGERIGQGSSAETAEVVFEAIMPLLAQRGIYLAAQCCEHLNRAIVVERDAVPGADIVNVVPQPKAGGSFGTAAYRGFERPVVVERIRADAGLDIGGTLIGMHLKEVAVPVRLATKNVGEAILLAARTRPKFIGGCRAVYDEKLL